jgi:uncharacterized damage-inducible protein DinB
MHALFVDFLDRLKAFHEDFAQTIAGLSQEALDWTPGRDMNSLTVLIMHATGAARFWVGDVCLGDVALCDRDAELRAHGMDEATLRRRIENTTQYIQSALECLSLDDLSEVRPAPGRNREYRVAFALLHALEHTALHVGHAQITRQLWDQRFK